MAESVQGGGSRKGAMLKGIFLGALLGYPVSYWFQPAMLRVKLSFGDYFSHIGDVLGEGELLQNVIIATVVMMIVGGAAGAFLGKR